MENRLRRADRQHEIRVEQRGVHANVASLERKRDEVRRLGIVHLHRAAVAARELGRNELLDVAIRRAPRQPAGDEDRRPLRGDARPFELVDRRGDSGRARLDRCLRHGLRGRFDHDGRAASPRNERLERVAREGKAKGVAHRGRNVGGRLARGRRSEHDGVVARVDDGDLRPGEERNARHAIRRCSRRKLVWKPRRGQKREESRFVTRQSVIIVL